MAITPASKDAICVLIIGGTYIGRTGKYVRNAGLRSYRISLDPLPIEDTPVEKTIRKWNVKFPKKGSDPNLQFRASCEEQSSSQESQEHNAIPIVQSSSGSSYRSVLQSMTDPEIIELVAIKEELLEISGRLQKIAAILSEFGSKQIVIDI